MLISGATVLIASDTPNKNANRVNVISNSNSSTKDWIQNCFLAVLPRISNALDHASVCSLFSLPSNDIRLIVFVRQGNQALWQEKTIYKCPQACNAKEVLWSRVRRKQQNQPEQERAAD